MIQYIPRHQEESARTEIARLIGPAAGRIASNYQKGNVEREKEKKSREAKKSFYHQLTGQELPEGLSPELEEKVFAEAVKVKGKEDLLNKKINRFSEIFGGQGQEEDMGSQLAGMGQEAQELPQDAMEQMQGPRGFDPSKITPQQIAEATALDPTMGRALQGLRDTALKQEEGKTKAQRKEFVEERKYHTEGAKKAAENANNLRATLPRKEMALDFARNAIESGNVGYFSLDKLADVTGSDAFRTAKGAQLITAGKENLLTNMARVGAKAQNLWFEQRLNSMFPKIGQSEEANLTTQEMIEAETALDRAYLTEYDRLEEEDKQNYGFTMNDIEKRAHDNIRPQEKQIFNRAAFRMREQEENEMGLEKLKRDVGKNVPKGTPWTLAMAKLYYEKFGDKAAEVAKKNGYRIPTLEEYKIFRSVPGEFREGLGNE